MKLYYAPGACSLSPHIALREAGLAFDLAKVSTKTHQTADGGDFYAINSKGYVPVLEWDDGERLTEGPAIVQWIADQAPDKNLAPPAGTRERSRLQEWLNFITTELHKGFGPLFNPAFPADAKPMTIDKLKERFAWVDAQLAGKDYLMGAQFTVADAYLFTVTNWAGYVQLSLEPYANLRAHQARVAARPAVQAALEAEGLKK